MPFFMLRDNIVNRKVDAVVNPANETLLEGSGTSYAIYKAAGEEQLNAACARIGHCKVGESVITEGFALSKYIIHTVGPLYVDGNEGEAELLAASYRSALKLAWANGCKDIAFPLLSAGNYGFPKREALEIAVKSIQDVLLERDMTVYLVLYDREAAACARRWNPDLQEYITDKYVEDNNEDLAGDEFYREFLDFRRKLTLQNRRNMLSAKYEIPKYSDYSIQQSPEKPYGMAEAGREEREPKGKLKEDRDSYRNPEEGVTFGAPQGVEPGAASRRTEPESGVPGSGSGSSFSDFDFEISQGAPNAGAAYPGSRREIEPKSAAYNQAPPKSGKKKKSGFSSIWKNAAKFKIEELMKRKNETFSEMLLRLIDERGMKDADIYKKANLTKQHFNKIKNKEGYTPKKPAVFALALALELSLDETIDLMAKAGHAFSDCSKTDIIIRYYIENEVYDIFEINEVLFHYHLELLGA
ncbi:MAG: macro domain-containing protein [Eubacteriales bacterium]|nr:macro domain-containing protein [Eubacteriales bacterium]